MSAVSNLDSTSVFSNSTIQGARPQESLAVMASFNRPGDAAPYGANDVVSDSTSTARALAFPGCGRGGLVHSASLVVAHTATADYDLFLFETEPTNFLDNAALALVAGDQPKCIGFFRFLNASKVNMGTNLELYRATSAAADQALPPMGYVLSASETNQRLFGILVTRSAYTPANANKFTIRLAITRNGLG